MADTTTRAERALARLGPLEFAVATDVQTRDDILRMRYECVVAQGWAMPADYPDGRERDSDDEEAIFVVGRDGGALVASLRVVLPTRARPLPTERDFRLRVRPAGGVVEVGRIVVAPAARAGRSHFLLGGLCARAWLEIRALGYDRALSTAEPDVLDLYRALGMRVTILGPAQHHWGAPRVPILVEDDEGSFSFLTG